VSSTKIYFDGFLPHTKESTRHERLTNSTKRLAQYHTTHPIPCRLLPELPPGGESTLFGSSSAKSSLTALPPLPFLVPAVLEALTKLDIYKDAVEVVPGEADLYCAKYANEYGGLILTGDSDLLVHDLGTEGAVSFFKDIQREETGGFTSQIYRPTEIADRLGLPGLDGLHSLAFEMKMDSHGTFPKLIAQSKSMTSIQAFPKMFAEFTEEYKRLPKLIESNGGDAAKGLLLLQRMDPRISEYVLQFCSLARMAGQVPLPPTLESAHVFLPFLSDCPVRTNAWEISTPIRELAYSLINLIVPESEQKLTVFEHRRQQDKSKGVELHTISLSTISEACQSLLNVLMHLKSKSTAASHSDFWLTVAIHQEMDSAHLYGKSSLSEAIVQGHQKSRSTSNIRLTWDEIHFLSQVHSSHYSFRILKQITSLVAACDNVSIPSAVLSLDQQLISLPNLSTLPSYSDLPLLVAKVGNLRMLKTSREILGIPEPATMKQQPGGSSSSKKGKRKRGKLPPTPAQDSKRSSNIFSLLDME
jgi:hypothetical protein